MRIFLFSLIFLNAGLLMNRPSAAQTAEEMGQRLLDAMGGVDAWDTVRTVHNTAINHHPAARLPYIQEYWYDMQEPAHHTRINNFDMQRVRAYNSEGGWSLAEGNLTPFSAERLQNEMVSWSKSLYRKFRLLARKPDGFELTIGKDDRLEFRLDGAFLGWMIIGEDGAPVRHGGMPSTDNYTEFDELAEFGPAKWPRSGRDNDGWRFEMLSLELSDDAMPVPLSPPFNH